MTECRRFVNTCTGKPVTAWTQHERLENQIFSTWLLRWNMESRAQCRHGFTSCTHISRGIFNISDADVPDLEVIFAANAVDFYICVFICICMCFETRYEGWVCTAHETRQARIFTSNMIHLCLSIDLKNFWQGKLHWHLQLFGSSLFYLVG